MVDVLKKLATTLVHNHIQLSVPDKFLKDAQDLLLKDTRTHNLQTRAVIVVVGAGFSANAIGLPLGKKTIRMLKRELKVPKDYLEQELSRLSIQYRLDPQDFETVLLALSRFVPGSLLDALTRIFDRRFYTAQSCEILAHLLKHRFIDAIINFNFDEVLDQAIEDELGQDNYWKIISEGDLPSDIDHLWYKEKRLHLPLYIKPHGTASHRSSMRFTREDYFLLPEGINKLLFECLQRTPLTLLTLGFGMQSVEFAAIIREATVATKTREPNDIEVIAVDNDPAILERFPSSIDAGKRFYYRPIGGFSGFFKKVWVEVGKCSVSKKYRGTERHALLSKLFPERPKANMSEKARKGRGSLKNYLRDRTLVEIALATAKAKGFVNVGQLQASRAGSYLRYYLAQFPDAEETLYALCGCLGLRRYGYSRDTMRLPVKVIRPDQLIIDQTEWRHARDELIKKLRGQLSRTRRIILKPDLTKMLKRVLNVMYEGEEVEVCSPRSSHHGILYKNPLELRALVAMKVYSVSLLKDKWDLLICVAETAEWLLNDSIVEAIKQNQNARRMRIIVADRTFDTDLMKKYNKIDIKIVQLPWWLHNQHMTIALSRKNKRTSLAPSQALYFERRQRSLTINPLGLSEMDDLDAVLDVFVAYWIEAKHYGSSTSPFLVTDRNHKKAKEELLDG